MASKKTKWKDLITVTAQFPKFVSYADYFYATPASLFIRNDGAEALSADITLECADGLFIEFGKKIELPFEGTVELAIDGIFSPVFLADCDEKKECAAEAVVCVEGKEVCRSAFSVTALPFDWWEGLSGNPERIAAFVRPRMRECPAVLAEAGKKLKQWGVAETDGYTGTDKNGVRSAAAAIFAAIRSHAYERAPMDCTEPLACTREQILKETAASPLQLAVLAAACLEAAHFHPVLAIGKESVGVGVWLYESCFLDTVTDDTEIVGKYISEGINNLSFIDAEDLFADKKGTYTQSESHFREKLAEGHFEFFTDIRRCRLGGISPCPARGKGLHGYEIYKEEELSDSAAPAPLPLFKKLRLEGRQPKNKQWERRLLDLSGKNALLHFTGKNALHIVHAGADDLYARLEQQGVMKLHGGTETSGPFGTEVSGQQRELVQLEQSKGILRTYSDAAQTAETALKLFRKNREADEETGASILYLAFGFLGYGSKEEKSLRYAPLVLSPVSIRRGKGNEEFSLEGAKEFFVNTTLLESLKQEYNIDVRGLDGDVSALKIGEILAMVRAETSSMKGWKVTEDVYLSSFSFQRYLMWNDLRRSFEEFRKNAVVSALLTGKTERSALPAADEDQSDPAEVFLPMPSDSSQYAAVALSAAGASFVLHGPPGTGKSQTITNIIANALAHGKRVLFVAEKKAAIDVVKKRLDSIGIGDFCLELHSNKADKSEVLKRLDTTLHLRPSEDVNMEEPARELTALREELLRPMLALHKKRRLGISVYQAILLYLQNKNAPDILDIESSFYDSLTESKLAECKRMIASAAAAAKECGGVFRSPFENVNLTEYSQELRDKVFCACEVLIAEIKHLKAFLSLFLEFYRQRVSTLTERKLRLIAKIANDLHDGVYARYFNGVDEGEFYVFFNANKRLDHCLEYYFKHFKSLVEVDRMEEVKAVAEQGGDWKLNRAALAAVKKLRRVALHTIADEDVPKFLQTLAEIDSAGERIRQNTSLSKFFCDRNGKLNYKKREEFLSALWALHADCASVFLDYNADAFNGMCIRAANGYTAPVLEGYVKAADSFFAALNSFLTVTKAEGEVREEDLESYSAKASALLDNVDMLPNWCMYRKTVQELASYGLNFISEALESGRLKVENILAGFEKNVYKNFLEINIPADDALSRLTVGTLEDTVEKFRLGWEEYARLTREHIRALLLSRLPQEGDESGLGLEVAAFTRLSKSNLRGSGLRTLFEEIPTLSGVLCPCMLMSPTTVAQYLQPTANAFDLVIFDEASQMTTAEAVGSLARAKAAIIVGDPRQLPPTSFFRTDATDEDDPENEDLESVLDDCLAAGMPERHLIWHYRSKHESLIAFSNVMYYDNRLCTFPSPDSLESRVRLVETDGSYDRGFTKRNHKEAEALVAEVVRRLQDPVLRRSSMGIVTFSSAQQDTIERLLAKEIAAKKLDFAYEGEEPIFVKNLENVQGDERDIILFSVCYGPDRSGRLSLNFGPLNQAGGWRRLNVAVSRAREEMIVFTSMTSSMIDLRKTSSKGVAGLKAFLEFAEKGRTTLAVRSAAVRAGAGLGKYIAAELESYGYECRSDVGASDFKVDVAVLDPSDKHRFLLGILCDGTDAFSVKDRNLLQVQTLKRGNWNVMRINSVNYYNNPKREIKRIKDVLDRLTGADRKAGAWLSKLKKPYKAVKTTAAETAAFVTAGDRDGEICARLKEIVATEEPISRAFLKKRCLATFGIQKSGSKTDARLDALIDGCLFQHDRIAGVDYFYKNPRAIRFTRVRVDEGEIRRTEEDLTAYEVISLVKGALEDRVSLYMDEVVALASEVFRIRTGERLVSFVRDCISYGEEKGLFVRSVSDRISLA